MVEEAGKPSPQAGEQSQIRHRRGNGQHSTTEFVAYASQHSNVVSAVLLSATIPIAQKPSPAPWTSRSR